MTLVLNMETKGGRHPDKRMDAVENSILKKSLEQLVSNPAYLKKGLKWTYNWLYFLTFWSTKDPALIDLIQDLRPYPQFIEVETTTRCNLKCNMCEHTYWNEPARDMTYEQFKSIIDQFPDLKWIGMTGIGESFLLKDFMKMIKYVKTKTGAFIELYDSFSFMTEEQVMQLVELGVDRIIASIDASTKETYEKIRKGGKWDTVWKNVRLLNYYKKKAHSYHPELAFHYIITKDNIHEVVDYLDLLDEKGISVAFVQYARMLHKYPETAHLYVEVPKVLQEEILTKARKVNIKISWNLNLPQDKPYFKDCTAFWMPFIFVTGEVVPCCATNEQNRREFQKETSLGNVFKEPFRDIWYGEKYKKLINGIRSGNTPIQCKVCPIFKVG